MNWWMKWQRRPLKFAETKILDETLKNALKSSYHQKFTSWSEKTCQIESHAKMHKVEMPSERARSMIADKLHIMACAWNVSLSGMSLVYHHITVVTIVDVATGHRCSGLD